MQFGRDVDIEAVDFSLPDDSPATSRVLRRVAASAGGRRPLSAYIGCPRWGLPEWVGLYYPRAAARSEYLGHYGRLFNAVELNSTFYAVPAASTLERWAASVPEGFRFCPKVPRTITHDRRLRDCADLAASFADSMRSLGPRLGPCFLQLPPAIGPSSVADLEAFLRLWPRELDLSVELRHRGWFQRGDEAFRLLEQHGAAAVITDSAGRRDAVHQRLTSGTAFVRFLGNNLHPTDLRRIDDWAERLCGWADEGLERVYFFVHQPDERRSPELVAALIERLNARLGLSLELPRRIEAPA